jgi:hypothetical protein
MKRQYLNEWKKYLAESESLNEASGEWSIETKALNDMIAKMNAKLAEIDSKRETPFFGDLKFGIKETRKSMDFGGGVQGQIPVWNFTFGGYPLQDYGLSGEWILASKGGNKSKSFKTLWLQPFKWNADKINALVKKSRGKVPRSQISTALRQAERIAPEAYNNWLAQREGAGDIQDPR